MIERMMRRGLASLLLASAPAVVHAQAEKLAGRFPPAAERSLRATIDSARAERLPVDPLVQRALEGASRGVDPAKVANVVTALHGRLRIARQALGAAAAEPELVAAASALYLGISADTLQEMRRQQPGKSLALPLVVLADMVHQGVPRDTAAGIIVALNRAGVADETYRTLRQTVLLDIRSGVPPAAAASVRARGALLDGARAVPPARARPQGPSFR